jgi:hypothetical protein
LSIKIALVAAWVVLGFAQLITYEKEVPDETLEIPPWVALEMERVGAPLSDWEEQRRKSIPRVKRMPRLPPRPPLRRPEVAEGGSRSGSSFLSMRFDLCFMFEMELS